MQAAEGQVGRVVEVEGVDKAYGRQRVLDGVDLRVERGERVALMGPSGSGKSTLLSLLAGLEIPDQGRILVLGEDLAALPESGKTALRRGRVTSIFQFFHLLPTLTAAENVEFPLLLARMPAREREARVRKLLEEVGLGDRGAALPEVLSGGEMQRLAIARALITEPALILADEPTGSLDSRNSVRILDLLRDLTDRHGTALLMATHDPEAAAVCDRILQIRDGRLSGEAAA